ncbi:MAG: hypothetical protein K2N51_14035 [Lachnospiraceae bacterium]|nr:hypothetical protein [Lachnospiraceae bacterium]
MEAYEWIKGGGKKNICQECGTGTFINYMENISGKKETMNVFEYEYTMKVKGKDER